MTTNNGSISFQLFNEIGIIHQLASHAFESALPDGLKLAQFTVLNHCVRLGDGKTPAQLASAFQVTKGAMTNTLNRLLVRNLVTVTPDPNDGRSKRVYLTEQGKQAEFSEEEFVAALPFLQSLRKYLDQSR